MPGVQVDRRIAAAAQRTHLGAAWIGAQLGQSWNNDPRLKAFFHQADLAIGLTLVAAGGFYLWHKLHGLKKKH